MSLSRPSEHALTDNPRSNYMDERPLLIIMHDPPEVLASPDPRTGKLELHNTWLVSNLFTVRFAQTGTDK